MLSKLFSWFFGNKPSSVNTQITDSVTVEPKKIKQPRKPREPNKKKKV